MILWSNNMKKYLSILLFILGMCSNSPVMAEKLEPIELELNSQEKYLSLLDKSTNSTPEFLPDYRVDDYSHEEEFVVEKLEVESGESADMLQAELEATPVPEDKTVTPIPTLSMIVRKKHPILPNDRTLLNEHLYFQFDKGPAEDLLVYGAYRGDLGFNFFNGVGNHMNYDTFMGEAGFVGRLRELPIDYRFSFNFVPVKDVPYWNAMILDNFITIKAGKHNKVRIGHTRTANGYEGGMSGYLQPLIMKSQISRTFSNARSLGAKVIGSYDLVDYDIGVFSSDRFLLQFFPGAEFVGNINFKPLGKTDGKYGKLLLGTSFNVGSRDNYYKNIGFNVAYKYKKFKWDFEYMAADGYNGRSTHSSTARAEGFYTTLYYKLTDKVELLARYDQITPNKDVSHKPQKEYTAGINYRLKGDALKLMINYVYYDNFSHNTGSRLLVGTQLIF